MTTGFLAEAFGEGWRADPGALPDARIAAALRALGDGAGIGDGIGDGWSARIGAGDNGRAGDSGNSSKSGDAGGVVRVRARWLTPDQVLLTPRNGVARRFTFTRDGDLTVVNHPGSRWRLCVLSEVQALARVAPPAALRRNEIKAEMPGAITAINVAPGERVAAGDVLVVMEAMKLIFPLAAPRAGAVAAVRCAVGEIVARGQTVVELEPDAGSA